MGCYFEWSNLYEVKCFISVLYYISHIERLSVNLIVYSFNQKFYVSFDNDIFLLQGIRVLVMSIAGTKVTRIGNNPSD